MTAPSHIRTAVARDPLNDWKRPIGHDMPRASDAQNRATAYAFHKRQRARTGRAPEIDLDALLEGRLGKERRTHERP